MTTEQRLREALEHVLRWTTPAGTIEQYCLPPWLAEKARAALAAPSQAQDTPSLPEQGRHIGYALVPKNGAEVEWLYPLSEKFEADENLTDFYPPGEAVLANIFAAPPSLPVPTAEQQSSAEPVARVISGEISHGKQIIEVVSDALLPLKLNLYAAHPPAEAPQEPQSDRGLGEIIADLRDSENEASMVFSAKEMRGVLNAYKTYRDLFEQVKSSAPSHAAAMPPASHILYTDNDNEKPSAILDRNGQVALALCKVCGKGESELTQPCTSPPAVQTAVPSEREWEFPELCELLPEDSHWNIELTPDLLQRILSRAALASPSAAPLSEELPPLPKVGPVTFASANDISLYREAPKVGRHIPGYLDVPLYTADQMREYARTARALSRTAPEGGIEDE